MDTVCMDTYVCVSEQTCSNTHTHEHSHPLAEHTHAYIRIHSLTHACTNTHRPCPTVIPQTRASTLMVQHSLHRPSHIYMPFTASYNVDGSWSKPAPSEVSRPQREETRIIQTSPLRSETGGAAAGQSTTPSRRGRRNGAPPLYLLPGFRWSVPTLIDPPENYFSRHIPTHAHVSMAQFRAVTLTANSIGAMSYSHAFRLAPFPSKVASDLPAKAP
jgi:hypothetical protein